MKYSRLWTHLDTQSKLSDALRDAYKLELLLGLRIGEIVGAKQDEIDLGAATWTIPAVAHQIQSRACATHPGAGASDSQSSGQARWEKPMVVSIIQDWRSRPGAIRGAVNGTHARSNRPNRRGYARFPSNACLRARRPRHSRYNHRANSGTCATDGCRKAL